MKKTDQKLSQVMEDYLETIFVLSKTRGYARTGEIARELNVSPSSVVEMVGKISRLGFANWKRYEGVFLTDEGRMRGEVIHIRHETLRQFFEFIGVNSAVANKEACIIEHELSPVTTSAIGNLVRFLQTSAGSQTISALECFLKFESTGLSYDGQVTSHQPVSTGVMVQTAIKSLANQDILSVITRHDLLNTLTGLLRYLDLLRSLSIGEEMNLVISRIDTMVQSMNRQISSGSEYPGLVQSGHQWMNIGRMLSTIIPLTCTTSVNYNHNLDFVELYGDRLLEKVFFTLMEDTWKRNEGCTHITWEYSIKENMLILSVQDDIYQNQAKETPGFIRILQGKTPDDRMFSTYQILKACGMQIREQEIPEGEGICFEIIVPDGLYRIDPEKCAPLSSAPVTKISLPEPGLCMTRAS